MFRRAISTKWHLRRDCVKQNGDTNCGLELKNKNTHLSTKKEDEVLKKDDRKASKKAQNVVRDYGNGSERVKGINRGEKVRKW